MVRVLLAGTVTRRLQRLKRGLVRSSHQVKTACSNAEVWQAVMQERVDIIVLDASTSSEELEPWRLCAELRPASSASLIALIRAGRNQDRLRAFKAGVSHCLTMPVSPAELAACLESVARPKRIRLAEGGLATTSGYSDPVLQIDLVNGFVRRDGKVYLLSPREALLLQSLLKDKGRIVAREDLRWAIWFDVATPIADQRLKMHISLLRQKIERDPKHPSYIISRRGVGYGFIPQSSPDKSSVSIELGRERAMPDQAPHALENLNS
jgi:two-component system alkaline phosphatase synthesis response regulator PhoP